MASEFANDAYGNCDKSRCQLKSFVGYRQPTSFADAPVTPSHTDVTQVIAKVKNAADDMVAKVEDAACKKMETTIEKKLALKVTGGKSITASERKEVGRVYHEVKKMKDEHVAHINEQKAATKAIVRKEILSQQPAADTNKIDELLAHLDAEKTSPLVPLNKETCMYEDPMTKKMYACPKADGKCVMSNRCKLLSAA